MMLTETLLGAIVEAVVSYALEQSGLSASLRSALGRDPTKGAFQKALENAYRAASEKYPDLGASLFDESFLTHEAVPVLAKLLWRHGRPTGQELAAAWADSLGLEGDTRQNSLGAISPVADSFLELLEGEAKKQPDLQRIFDHRAREQVAEHTSVLPEIRNLLRDHLSVAPSPSRSSTCSQASRQPTGDEETRSLVGSDLTDRLLHTLLEIPALSERDNRNMLLRNLPLGPVKAIGRSSAPMTDLNNILYAVASWGRSTSGELALVIVIRNALVFVRGTEFEGKLRALLAELEAEDKVDRRKLGCVG